MVTKPSFLPPRREVKRMECPTKMFGFNCGLEEQSRRACIIAQFSLEDTLPCMYLSAVCTLITARGSLRPAVFLRMLVRNLGERKESVFANERASEERPFARRRLPNDGRSRTDSKEREMRPSSLSFYFPSFNHRRSTTRVHSLAQQARIDGAAEGGPLKIT